MKKLKMHVKKIKQIIWPFWGNDGEGAPVYYEDTGDRMGTVMEVIRDANGEPSGYRVRHDETGTVATLSAHNLERTNRGFLFVPLWYVEARDLVRELEYASRHPALQDIVSGATLTHSDLSRATSLDSELQQKIDHARQVRQALRQQMKELEQKRREVREHLMRLSELRLLQEMSRREFAEAVMDARRQTHILEFNIKRCSEVLTRLDSLPFLPRQMPPPDTFGSQEDITPLKNIMHNIPINVAVIDQRGIILSVNEQFTKNMHYEPEDVKGKPLSVLMVTESQHLTDLCRNGTAQDVDFTMKDGRGKERHMFGRIMPVTDNGHEMVMALAFQEKIEESDEFRKLLTNQISHEFFNPLCIAQGYLYLLEEGKYGSLTPEQQRQIRSIAKNLKRIENLVKQTVNVKP